MNRRVFLRSMGLGAATLAMPRILPAREDDADRPNIILIMADDVSAKEWTSPSFVALGPAGNPFGRQQPVR
ncbi:MAG: hypothetical protein ISS78_01895 [Phycisphaerae bacterium]|nr:hypothetical protein [Phycisphaerae bacterium]